MYEIDEIDRDGIPVFSVRGDLDRESDRLIDDEIRRRCLDAVMRFAVIEIREVSGRLSLLDNHEAAKNFRQRIGDALDAVAIVERHEHRERREMFEITAINRGARVRFFDFTSDAVAWLDTRRPRS